MLEKLLKDVGKDIPRPFGIYLSGGLDSGILAALLKPDFAVSCNFKGEFYDELKYACAITNHLGIEHHILELDGRDFITTMGKAMDLLGKPLNHVSIYPWYKTIEYAKSLGAKVMLGGEGADETFGGYSRYLILKEIHNLYQMESLKGYKPMLDSIFGSFTKVHSKISGIPEDVLEKRYEEKKGRGIITQASWAEFNEGLPALVNMEVVFNSYFGIEFHLPFYDKEVQKYGWSLDDKDKLVGEIRKYKIWEIARKHLPKEVWERKDKKGFVCPANEWCGSKSKYDKTNYMKFQKELCSKSS